MSLQERGRLLIDHLDTLLYVPTNLLSLYLRGMSLFLCQENAFATPSVSPKRRDSSDKAVILLNNAKFVQASSGPHAVCLATEEGIFHSAFPGENSFIRFLFYRHRWKWVTAVRATVFLSRKYWCICVRMLSAHVGFVSSCSARLQNYKWLYLGQDGAPI